MSRRTIPLPFAVDLARSLRPLRTGRQDPTILLGPDTVLRATRSPDGPVTLRAERTGEVLEVEAWGPGAEWALETAPGLLGCLDDRAGFDPSAHPLVADLQRQAPGHRLPRTGRVFEAMLPAILGQRVTGFEARRSFRLLVERWGEPAPGPGGLSLVPAPDQLAELGYYDLHVIGVEKRRADSLKRVSAHAARLDQALLGADLRARLEALPGIGPWTSAEAARIAAGDADAVSVGDFHLKHTVVYALTGRDRGSDDEMLELLEPFAGHRGRVCLLIEAAGIHAPRRGPRRPIEPTARR
jgi:3-methyladenine DNA glycosylase/8-oxoguanine DNA glycosylase